MLRGVLWISHVKDLCRRTKKFSKTKLKGVGTRDFYFNVQGRTVFASGNYEQAINDFNKTIELNPKYAEAYTSRGIYYYASGIPRLAINDFNKTIELNPQNADAYYMRGSTYEMLGNTQQATKDYDKAIELDAQLANRKR